MKDHLFASQYRYMSKSIIKSTQQLNHEPLNQINMYDCISSVTNRDILAIIIIHSTHTTRIFKFKTIFNMQNVKHCYRNQGAHTKATYVLQPPPLCISERNRTRSSREFVQFWLNLRTTYLTIQQHHQSVFFFFIQTLCAWNSSAHRVKQWNSPCVVLQSNPPTKSFLSRVDAMPLSQTLCKRHTFFFFKRHYNHMILQKTRQPPWGDAVSPKGLKRLKAQPCLAEKTERSVKANNAPAD